MLLLFLYSCFFFCLFVCFLKLKIYLLIHIRLCGWCVWSPGRSLETRLLFFWPYAIKSFHFHKIIKKIFLPLSLLIVDTNLTLFYCICFRLKSVSFIQWKWTWLEPFSWHVESIVEYFSKIIGSYCNWFTWKQPCRSVLWKRCSRNVQQVYWRKPIQKCDFNKVALQIYWSHTSAWMFSCKLAAYFQNTFL